MRKLVLGSWQLRSVKRSGNNGAQVRCRTGDSNDLVEALLEEKTTRFHVYHATPWSTMAAGAHYALSSVDGL